MNQTSNISGSTTVNGASRLWRLLQRCLPDIGLRKNADQMHEPGPRILKALAALLLLVQLPHVLHLPLWVSVLGAAIIALRLSAIRYPQHTLLKKLLTPVFITLLAVGAALAIRAHYGYFLGRDPSVAFLFLLVAAKFAELRRASDATLLLCMAAFLLLTQYFYAQTILSAVVTLPAVLALGHALAILRDSNNPSSSAQQLRLVAKMLLQGAPLAALLFVVFPRLPGPLWSLPEDAMGTTGLADSMAPGTIAELIQSDAVAFRVEFDTTIPPRSSRYWRGPVLSEFDGRKWGTSKVLLELPIQSRSPQSPDANQINYTVMLQPHRQRWLFALDNASSLPLSGAQSGAQTSADAASNRGPLSSQRIAGRLMSDRQLLAAEPVTQVTQYRQSSSLGDRYKPSRRPGASTLHLAGINTRTAEFARQMRSTVDSDSDFAGAVLQHFNQQDFYYTLKPQLLGNAPVDEFLFGSRRGFCEHYAAAFVVMMRSAGIPARVVTGYLGGEMNDDYMIVRQSDAHAWTEAFIDGHWQRFDPTAAVAPSRVEGGLDAALPEGENIPRMARKSPGWVRDMQLRWDAMNHQWQRLIVNFDNDSQSALWQKLGLGKPALWQLTALVLLAAALWCAAVLGLPELLGRRKLPVNERAWQRVQRLLQRHGIARQTAETPSDYLQRAAKLFPKQQVQLDELLSGFNQLRFARSSGAIQHEQLQQLTRITRRLQLALWKQSLLPGSK